MAAILPRLLAFFRRRAEHYTSPSAALGPVSLPWEHFLRTRAAPYIPLLPSRVEQEDNAFETLSLSSLLDEESSGTDREGDREKYRSHSLLPLGRRGSRREACQTADAMGQLWKPLQAIAWIMLAILCLSLLVQGLPTSRTYKFGAGTTLGGRLNQTEVNKRLLAGRPILGDVGDLAKGEYTSWMRGVDDGRLLTMMNLPGVHDAATWNYTAATREEFLNITGAILPNTIFRCQDRSFFQMLGDGIRVFDLRIGYLPNGVDIGFYHGSALLSDSATLEDVLYGFYYYLDTYVSETLIISIKVDNTTWQPSDFSLEKGVYNLLTTGVGKKFWSQVPAELGTLGQRRGKLIFLRRLDWSTLTPASSFPGSNLGIAVPPPVWLDNSLSFSIQYSFSPAPNRSAYIEDYYEIGGPPGVETKTKWKYNATSDHLKEAANATGESAEALWITFASAEQDRDSPPETPKVLALGSGTVPGVNQRLLPFLRKRQGQRMGILLFDWYHSVDGLVDAYISR